jgi:hypothetical protein
MTSGLTVLTAPSIPRLSLELSRLQRLRAIHEVVHPGELAVPDAHDLPDGEVDLGSAVPAATVHAVEDERMLAGVDHLLDFGGQVVE